jgi:hypothetical protein
MNREMKLKFVESGMYFLQISMQLSSVLFPVYYECCCVVGFLAGGT